MLVEKLTIPLHCPNDPVYLRLVYVGIIIFTGTTVSCNSPYFQKFKAFLNDQTGEHVITGILEKIDGHLMETGTKFLLKDTITRADCYLLPTLQHLRVAGKVRIESI